MHKATIDRLLAEAVWNAKVIWRELQAKGYTGRYTDLRDYIQPKRALSPGRATVGLREFAPEVEALERFVRRAPLYRVHERALGVLALESQPVDPQL